MLALRTRGMRPQAKIRWQPQRLKRQGRILPQGLRGLIPTPVILI